MHRIIFITDSLRIKKSFVNHLLWLLDASAVWFIVQVALCCRMYVAAVINNIFMPWQANVYRH